MGVLISLTTLLIAYRFFWSRGLDRDREKLLAKQRAVDATVGQEWYPLRDKIEKFVIDSSREWPGDWTDSTAGNWDFRAVPGIYLRLRVAEAHDTKTLRDAAQASLKDAFVGCLLREPNVAGARGEIDPDAGELAHHPFADQPWNLRQAYQATRILTPEWVTEVKEASDDLRLRVFEQQYEKAASTEIPTAIDLLKRAQFFLLVLDEDTPGATTSDSLQLVPHDARVRILNLKTGNEVARLRRRAEGGVYGEPADPEIRDAVRRQVNNCALAMHVAKVLNFEKK